MFVSDSADINSAGHLTFGNVDTIELASRFGTPLYVMDEDAIRANCKSFVSAFIDYYNGNGTATYASKAFSCIASAKIMAQEGMSLDTVSAGEIYTAIKAGFPVERIFFHGNNKSDDELEYAIINGVGRIVSNSIEEAKRTDAIAKRLGRKVRIILRVTPGIDAHTHSFIKTGQNDSKFGVTLESGEAFDAIMEILTLKYVELMGIHSHIGSQIFEVDPFLYSVNVMTDFMMRLKNKLGFITRELSLGGGFAVRYTHADPKQDCHKTMRLLLTNVKKCCDEKGLVLPYICVEPGRSIVGECGITLYSVGEIKEIRGIRNYVSVDGGMVDNPRYALYQSAYEACIANKATQPRDYVATICGKCCESGDMLQENALIQRPNRGDILAIFTTGAYNYSMSSNYNRICKPAVIMLSGGIARVVVKRETFEDLIRNDISE